MFYDFNAVALQGFYYMFGMGNNDKHLYSMSPDGLYKRKNCFIINVLGKIYSFSFSICFVNEFVFKFINYFLFKF